MRRDAKRGSVAMGMMMTMTMMVRLLTSSAAKTVAARSASRAREDHLKLTIVPDSEKEGVMNEEEKEGDVRSKSQLGAWRIDVVKSWCVQSGNWLAPRVVRAPRTGGAVARHTPNIHVSRYRGRFGVRSWRRGV
jgi:hypothetical protein